MKILVPANDKLREVEGSVTHLENTIQEVTNLTQYTYYLESVNGHFVFLKESFLARKVQKP